MDDLKRPPLYAQFDGDEINGTRYDHGDEIKDDVDAGTIAFLTQSGRIAASKPSDPNAIVAVPMADVRDMNRFQLLSELGTGQDDDALRDAVMGRRALIEEHGSLDAALANFRGDTADAGKLDPESYDSIKDLPLAGMTTARLNTVAEAESVTFDPETVKTNADRVAAIEAARKAKTDAAAS